MMGQTSEPWRKRHQTALIVGVVLTAVAIVTVASVTQRASSGDGDDGDRCYATTYSITANGSIAVTFQTGSGQTSQRDVASGSFAENFCGAAGSFVYVSAQVQRESGRVSCSIKSTDHTTIANESSGDYVIATCSGRL